jgi:hypothetical protein
MLHPILVLSTLSHFAAVGAGVYVIRFLSAEMKTLLAYCGIALTVEMIQAYLAINGIKNLWLLHVFTILEFGFLITVYSSWQKNRLMKRILQATIPIFALIGIMVMSGENIEQFNHFTRPLGSLILVAAAAMTLFELNKESGESVFLQPRFWVGAAGLIYFSSTLVLFALSNLLLTWPIEQVRLVFAFNSAMNIIANLGYAAGFLCRVQVQKSFGH